MQQDLFTQPHTREWRLGNECKINLTTELLPGDLSQQLFQTLQDQLQWEQSEIRIAGRFVKIPRLNAWYGDANARYQYSGALFSPIPWTPELLEIRQIIEKASRQQFNSVLANLYRDEQDSVSWHADDEPELGRNPIIASLSLGETRRFLLRPKDKKSDERIEIKLPGNSLLLMSGPLQHQWLHQIPKSSIPKGPRLNLTFRAVLDRSQCRVKNERESRKINN